MNILVSIFFLIGMTFSLKPEICSLPEAKCASGSSCTVSCIDAVDCAGSTMNVDLLEKSLTGFINATHDYSNVHTILLEGCLNPSHEFDVGTTKFVLKGGSESSTFKILPYPDENVIITSSDYCFFDDTGADFVQIGYTENDNENGVIKCKSEKGVYFSQENNLSTEKPYESIILSNMEFSNSGNFAQTYLEIKGDSSKLSSIQVLNTDFLCNSPCQAIGIKVSGLINDPNTISQIELSSNKFVNLKQSILITLVDGIGITENGNYFQVGDNVGSDPIVSFVDINEANVNIKNSIFYFEDTVPNDQNEMIKMTSSDTSTYKMSKYVILNNMFSCKDTTNVPSKIIEFDTGILGDVRMHNNIINKCHSTMHFGFGADASCSNLAENGCIADFTVTDESLLKTSMFTVEVENSVTDSSIDLMGDTTGTLEKPFPFFSLETEILGAIDATKHPQIDMNGRYKENTKCPYNAGPISCSCQDGYEGDDCLCNSLTTCSQFYLNNIINFQTYEATRFDVISNYPDTRRLLISDRTIISTCSTKYWSGYITTRNEVFMWGDEIYNDYIDFDTDVPININFDDGTPIKLQCGENAMFLLTAEGGLYSMGEDDDYTLKDGVESEKFIFSLDEVYDIHTALHTLYVQKRDKTILALGLNYAGGLGVGSDSTVVSLSYMTVIDSEFPANYLDLDYARVQAFHLGVLFTFRVDGKNQYYMSGADHPSLEMDTNYPRRIDFDGVTGSQLSNSDPIDFISRHVGGCLHIISGKDIYVSGDYDDCGDFGLGKGSPTYPGVPFKIQNYGAYNKFTDKIYNFECNQACYLLTATYVGPKIFVWGRTDNGVDLDLGNCESNECNEITLASTSSVGIALYGKRGFVIEGYYHEKFQIGTFDSPVDFDLVQDSVVDSGMEVVYEESSLYANTLSLVLRRKEKFFRLNSELTFSNANNLFVDKVCQYPNPANSEWEFWNEEYGGINYDYYRLTMHWGDHRVKCQWINAIEGDYDVYSNTINVVESYYRGYEMGIPSIRTESTAFGIQIKFPIVVMESSFTVELGSFSEFYDVLITDKSFDRTTRTGIIRFMTIAQYPIYFEFGNPKIGEMSQYDENGMKVSDEVEYFVKEDMDVNYLASFTNPTCDAVGGTCNQMFEFVFTLIDDYRVCRVPKHVIPINWMSTCEDFDDVYCFDNEDVTFDINLTIDNLCGGVLVEDILTTFEMNIYLDFAYNEPVDTDTHVFTVGDWIYFEIVLESTKVSIVGNELDQVQMIGTSISFDLYNAGVTTVGDDCGFAVDVVEGEEGKTQSKFHFKLSNLILQLGPGAEKSYSINVMLKIFYEGNQRRDDGNVDFGFFFSSKQIDFIIFNDGSNNASALPYIVSVGVVLFIFVVVIVMILMGVAVLVKVYKENQKNSVDVKKTYVNYTKK